MYVYVYIYIYHWAHTATTNKPKGRHCGACVCPVQVHVAVICTTSANYGVIDTSAKNLKIRTCLKKATLSFVLTDNIQKVTMKIS